MEQTGEAQGTAQGETTGHRELVYDQWVKSIGIPIHRGYYIEDLRTLELDWWEERKCKAAFIQLAGQEGVSEARVTEIAPGATLPPLKFALDEIVYVVEGRGLTTVWTTDDGPRKTFEWQKHSLFLIPHGHVRQFSNTQGNRPVRLLHYNYLPIAASAVLDPQFLFNNPYESPDLLSSTGGDFYSAAKSTWTPTPIWQGHGSIWYGNFFPDMRAWDKLNASQHRGAGGHSVYIEFPGSEMSCHMSVFDAKTYKKAHRHGPARIIVIPDGEGYSIMWREGEEKVVVPWHEASVFTPPDKWFHQHFNVGEASARYLALHPLSQFRGYGETVEDIARDQIEYPDQEPFIRQKFEEELAKRGLTSLMPEEAYKDRDYQWAYSDNS